MIIVPELRTVVILVPRTGSRSLRKALLARYPLAMQLYRHMEADGVPTGYDRWRRLGVVRDPVERLWSLYRYLKWMDGPRDGFGKWEPTYIERQRKSAALPFERWIVENEVVFSSPYSSRFDGEFFPGFNVLHTIPENRKSQFVYLRPDLGVEVRKFTALDELHKELGVEAPLMNHNPNREPIPILSGEAKQHVEKCFAWDFEECAR